MSDLVKKSVKISIAGRQFPVKLSEEEAKSLRKIEAEINRRILQFGRQYDAIDKEAILGMTVISYAFDLFKLEQEFDQSTLQKELQKLDKSVTDVLEKLS